MSIVIIDSSYYNFYRFHATVKWYNYSPERREEATNVAWLDNPTFMKTFEKMWFQYIDKICKKFSVERKNIIFARDGKNVWRYKLFPKYKAQRANCNSSDDCHTPGPVFKHVNEHFHSKLGVSVIRNDLAEADDIAAVTVRYIRVVYPNKKIVLITGDHDFLQLSEPGHVEIYQLRGFTNITSDNPHLALMTKILAGDPSDNIPQAFKGCGKKTAEKIAKDPVLLQEYLTKHGSKQFELNQQLVDFDYIPENIVVDIENVLDDIL